MFFILESFSLYLLFNFNDFQQSAFFSTANRFNGYLFKAQESVYGYFNLKSNNEALLKENNELQLKLARMESSLRRFTDSTQIPLLRMKASEEFTLIPARVIQNTVTHYRNYITLNVGSKDGVRPEMGVSSAEGIVGVVSMVSDHYSVVIPVLHKDQRFTCELKNSHTMGSLVWDGFDRRIAYLEGIPTYQSVSDGDTVVTSENSSIFPQGIMVGVVEDYRINEDANDLRLKVRLATRFDALSNVRVIRYVYRGEQKQLEEQQKEQEKEVIQ
jgi:rod shape-determining protein MreC